GIPVCFYYGSTGFACAWYYRRELFKSVKKFLLVGLGPVIGGLMFYGVGIYACIYYGHKSHAEGTQYLGLTLPLWLGLVGLGVGAGQRATAPMRSSALPACADERAGGCVAGRRAGAEVVTRSARCCRGGRRSRPGARGRGPVERPRARAPRCPTSFPRRAARA